MALVQLFALVIVVVAVVLVARGSSWGASPSERFLAAWALPTTAATVALSSRQLGRDGCFRRLGAWIGFFLATGWRLAADNKFSVDVSTLALVLAGSCLGVVWAARPPRPRPGSIRSAVIRPREIVNYRAEGSQRSEWGLATLVLVIGALVASVAQWRGLGGGVAGRAAITAGLALIATTLVQRLQRRVVEHPQPASDAELLAVDDAHRSSTVDSLHHAVMGLLLCLAILTLGALPTRRVPTWVSGVSVVVVVVLLGAALAEWHRVSRAPFRPQVAVQETVESAIPTTGDRSAEAP